MDIDYTVFLGRTLHLHVSAVDADDAAACLAAASQRPLPTKLALNTQPTRDNAETSTQRVAQ